MPSRLLRFRLLPAASCRLPAELRQLPPGFCPPEQPNSRTVLFPTRRIRRRRKPPTVALPFWLVLAASRSSLIPLAQADADCYAGQERIDPHIPDRELRLSSKLPGQVVSEPTPPITSVPTTGRNDECGATPLQAVDPAPRGSGARRSDARSIRAAGTRTSAPRPMPRPSIPQDSP